MSSPARRLIVVSNRLPLSFSLENGVLKSSPGSGGLISALEPLLKQHGGVWVGSAGTEESSAVHEALAEAARKHAFGYSPVFLTEEEQTNYYEGFSNEVIWPLFHDLQSRCRFDPTFWDFYRRVNEKFADATAAEAGSEDLVWIQDYQLMQVGRFLRSKRPHDRLAFFLHIPFPPPDIYAKLPWRREILESLLEYDLVGLQTGRDQRNFIACVRHFLPKIEIDKIGNGRVLRAQNRSVHVGYFPISIPFRDFEEQAKQAEVEERLRELSEQSGDVRIVLGMDRLDYTKGIPERLRAFGLFLREYPEHRRKVVFYQIVVPSRETIPEYQGLKEEVEQLVTRVNGEFSEPGWTPITYMHRSVPKHELLALYRAADVAVVTPLKDGMNLVAKEYCAARVDGGGTLVLSEFAGAAPEMRGMALMVNPYDETGVARALHQALVMTPQEQKRRMRHLRRHISRFDLNWWRDQFFAAFDAARAETEDGNREAV
ncbi:MAG: Alpha,alpha-trehalose-phosphate synthase [Bryobacterales bacterium]|nr:Alpha,alpha-trehalose-phosphate synthase [Bryobacterales bacterium]